MRTIDNRIAEVLSPNSPFKTVEEYTEWWLEKKGLLELSKEAEELQSQWETLTQRHISLDRLANKAIDLEDILIQDIDEHNLWDYDTVDAEQYLVLGSVQQVSATYYYRQGVGGTLEGKYQQKQDVWMESLD